MNQINPRYDAIVVGAGPNGLAAAITLARAQRSVLVLEARDTIGGGTRTAELTLPGYLHDICSAVQPMSLASPFLRTLPLAELGVDWIQPPFGLAHPLDDGTAVTVERSIEATAATLEPDSRPYQKLLRPFVAHWEQIIEDVLGVLPMPPHHPLSTAFFGLSAVRSALGLARGSFQGERARAVFCGMAAHSMLPLDQLATASFGLILNILAHAVGFPVIRGGSKRITEAMGDYFKSLGGEIMTGSPVHNINELPPARDLIFDVAPRQLISITRDRLPESFVQKLEKFRYGPGVFKIDYALDGPIPWKAEGCARAGTVHLGGTMEEIAASERAVWQGKHPENPYVLLAQQSLFDPTRAPQGKQTVWAYCHVPGGSTFDMTGRIEAQIDRFAPGFRDRILARHTMTAMEMEEYDPNYIGGDINGGVQDIWQLFTRPTPSLSPYTTPDKHIYLCSSSTPPGGGVHGMCGFRAAVAVLRNSP